MERPVTTFPGQKLWPEGSWERFIKLPYFTGEVSEESVTAGSSTQVPASLSGPSLSPYSTF